MNRHTVAALCHNMARISDIAPSDRDAGLKSGAAYGPAVLVAAALLALVPAAHGQQTGQARVYVSVMDSAGRPIERISPEAFHVWENDTSRTVVGAAPATEPPAIVVIVHGATRDVTQDLRKTLRALFATLRQANPDARIALTTEVKTPRLVNITSSAAELDKAVAHFVMSGPGLLFLEAVQDACNALDREPSDRRVVFAITNTLKSDGAMESAQQAAAALKKAGASLWATDFMANSQQSNANSVMSYEKENFLTSWTLASGGFHDAVFGTLKLQTAVSHMASLVLSQYAVTYNRPTGAAQGKLQVGVEGAIGERVLAPAWSAR